MTIRLRGSLGSLRRPASFSMSGLIHASLLVYLILGAAWLPPVPRASVYDQMFRPYEKKIVWYHLSERLPDIRPAQAPADPLERPLRALKKFHQEIVAGARDDARPPQLVWAPAPEPAPRSMQPLPNIVAVEPRPLVKLFVPPPPKPVTPDTPALPEAPPVAAPALDRKPPVEAAALKPLVRPFARPAQKTAVARVTALPDAPPVAAPSLDRKLPIDAAVPRALVRPFERPPEKPASPPLPAPALPDAPRIEAAIETASTTLPGATLKPLVKHFTAPAAPARPAGDPAPLPDLPPVASQPAHAEVPQLAIAGLDPAKTDVIPPAPPPREAAFSAGPVPRPEGASTDGEGAKIVVPGLTVRGGPRDSQASIVPKLGPPSEKLLLAGVRAMPPAPPAAPVGARVAMAPDPLLAGRVVYSIAIQMPNITSYSGSWIAWFAEHEPEPGAAAVEMRAPQPLRKVDPKYVASAVADGVEGSVRLSAIIRKTGRVDTVRLLKHLDDRLDQTAMEALAKWEFDPARRGGAPVDVDAVFEVPFRLAPKPLK